MNYKKLADDARAFPNCTVNVPDHLRAMVAAIDALLTERDSALDDHVRRYNEMLIEAKENTALRAKLATATKALNRIANFDTNVEFLIDAINIASAAIREIDDAKTS